MTTTEKTCFKCGDTKDINDFYAHPMMKDGRLNKCKECAKLDVKANYVSNIDHYRRYEKSRANLPKRVSARKEYASSPRGKIARARGSRSYRNRYPSKKIAHYLCGNAIRDGRIKKRPCDVCGTDVAQAHHDDYSKPLDIRWLCKSHHNEWHRHNKPKCPEAAQ